MRNYLSNLEPREDFCLRYFISSVSVGIHNALKDPNVKKRKKTYRRMSELYKEIMSLPCVFREVTDVDMDAIRKAVMIQYEAYDLVRDL